MIPAELPPGPVSESQLAYLATLEWCPDVFVAGDRGGGKSTIILIGKAQRAMRYGPAYRGLTVRKTYPALEQLMVEAHKIFPKYGAVYRDSQSSEFPQSKTWYFPNGATERMQHMMSLKDYEDTLHGKSFTDILVDEAPEYEDNQAILALYSLLRSTDDILGLMRMTGNPFGKGHRWVKRMYMNQAAVNEPFRDKDSGKLRMFTFMLRVDNAALANRSEYEISLLASTAGNSAKRRAWLNNDWDVDVDIPGALWTHSIIDQHRVHQPPQDLVRIVTGVDPMVGTPVDAEGSEDAPETGIVVCAKDSQYPPHFYVLKDASLNAAPMVWASKAVTVHKAMEGDRIIGEVNNGGELVEAVVKTVDEDVPFKSVRASRGKMIRAEPIAALSEQGRLHFVGFHDKLEDQCCTFIPGEKSPDRMDAMVWAVTELMDEGEHGGLIEYYRREAERVERERKELPQ